jgi:two-component system copper resistance phosphate regulon response regulator CusR
VDWAHKGTILLVAHDYLTMLLIRKVLTRAGFEVEWAEDGAEGMDFLRQMQFDLIILGGHREIEILPQIRRANKSAKVLAMSADTTGKVLAGAEKQGAATLAKPFNSKELLKVVRGLLSGKTK